MNNIKRISILFLFLLVVFPTFAFATGPTELPAPTGPGTSPQSPLVTCGGGEQPCSVEDFKILIQYIMNLVFIFAGFVAATMFMYAGFLLITAAGNTGQIQKAKDIFKRVVIGFLIMFASYLLVKSLLTRLGVVDDIFKNIIT